jgi:hypothetical protein
MMKTSGVQDPPSYPKDRSHVTAERSDTFMLSQGDPAKFMLISEEVIETCKDKLRVRTDPETVKEFKIGVTAAST